MVVTPQTSDVTRITDTLSGGGPQVRDIKDCLKFVEPLDQLSWWKMSPWTLSKFSSQLRLPLFVVVNMKIRVYKHLDPDDTWSILRPVTPMFSYALFTTGTTVYWMDHVLSLLFVLYSHLSPFTRLLLFCPIPLPLYPQPCNLSHKSLSEKLLDHRLDSGLTSLLWLVYFPTFL